MAVFITFFVFLENLRVQSVMGTQLEPYIAREVSECTKDRRSKGSLHQKSYHKYHRSYSTDVENVVVKDCNRPRRRGCPSKRSIICAGNK